MKLTATRLRQIIKEELSRVQKTTARRGLKEARDAVPPWLHILKAGLLPGELTSPIAGEVGRLVNHLQHLVSNPLIGSDELQNERVREAAQDIWAFLEDAVPRLRRHPNNLAWGLTLMMCDAAGVGLAVRESFGGTGEESFDDDEDDAMHDRMDTRYDPLDDDEDPGVEFDYDPDEHREDEF
jgi:hypothetical protein